MTPLLISPATARAVSVYQGSCYDALYFDGLTSRYSASHCASALTQAGYAASAFDNTTAQTAFERAAADAVMFAAGHSIDAFTNDCQPSCTGPHVALGMMFEGPTSSSDIDVLQGDPLATPLLDNAFVQVCSEGGGCRTQNTLVAYPWGTAADTYKMNLVVLEGCATAQDASYLGIPFQSMATAAYAGGAGTVIGFHDDILFPVNADETGQYGDGWANRFWSDLAAGYTYDSAMVDAGNAVGNAGGLGSYVYMHESSAPKTLSPAGFYL